MARRYGTQGGGSRALVLAATALAVAMNAQAGGRFSLSIEAALSQPRTPAEETRLATWNSPMGRVAYAVAREQAGLGTSGLVGHSTGVALRVGFRPHLRPELISAAVEQGLGTSERTLGRIHWPWEETGEEPQTMTLEEELSRLLGRRIEIR